MKKSLRKKIALAVAHLPLMKYKVHHKGSKNEFDPEVLEINKHSYVKEHTVNHESRAKRAFVKFGWTGVLDYIDKVENQLTPAQRIAARKKKELILTHS